jgi:hypothetical protein
MNASHVLRPLFLLAALACLVLGFLSDGVGKYFGSALLFGYAAQLIGTSGDIDILPYLFRLSRGLAIGVPLALLLCSPFVFLAPEPKGFIPLYVVLAAFSAVMFALSTRLERYRRS